MFDCFSDDGFAFFNLSSKFFNLGNEHSIDLLGDEIMGQKAHILEV